MILLPLVICDVVFGIALYLRSSLRDPVYIPDECIEGPTMELNSKLVYFSDLAFALYIVPCLIIFRLYVFGGYYSLLVACKFMLQLRFE
jgi:hypothetical protein